MPSKKESCTVGYVSSVGDISARTMNACMVEITKEIVKKNSWIDYYEERGADVKKGIPTKEKLLDLGLKNVAEDLERLHYDKNRVMRFAGDQVPNNPSWNGSVLNEQPLR